MIHTVGPVWAASEDRSGLLASCYRRVAAGRARLGARTVAFPAISTGVYRWPLEDGARLAVRTVREETGTDPDTFDEVRFVVFGADAETAFTAVL